MRIDVQKILKELRAEEKAALVAGTDFMYTNPVSRLGIPSVCTADGPHGLRKQIGGGDNGVTNSEPATAFPTAATVASGWNIDNPKKIGEAIGQECRHYGVHVLLGPGMNIKRNPLCGRNFEYYSEDPYLTGKLAKSFVNGVQSTGVGVSAKHFAANNCENFRFLGNSVIDERTLREIYLRAFEVIVKESHPTTLMCAYNMINGKFCSENKYLLTDILRKEWGYGGLVMTDWGAARDRIKGIQSGLDLEMPGDTAYCRKMVYDTIKSGELESNDIDAAVTNVLELINRVYTDKKSESFDIDGHSVLAADIATDCAVLMKNDGVLPINKVKKYLVLGELFENMRYQGAGSSMINPTFVTTPKNAFDSRGINYAYNIGYREDELKTDDGILDDAIKMADIYEDILIFAGLTDFAESEGGDRESMCLPENQLALINGIIKKGRRPVVILYGGSPVELSFMNEISALLNMYLPGQSGGEATARLLFGEANPSGKLAETWPETYADVPFGDEYSKKINELYKESIFVGYRWYGTYGKKVRFPFGYGLSYTNFEYSELSVTENGRTITVNCKIKNTGNMRGGEIAQLYIKNNDSSKIFKAEKELRAFTKVYLDAGEETEAIMNFKLADLSYYDTKKNGWLLENGIYQIQVAASYDDVRLEKDFEVTSGESAEIVYENDVVSAYKSGEIANAAFEKLLGYNLPTESPKKPITMETKFGDYRVTFMGKILFGAVSGVATGKLKKAKKLPLGKERSNMIKGAQFLYKIFETNSIRTLSMSAGKSMPYNLAEGMMEMANGHIIRGIRKILKKYKAPALPKDMENIEK